MEKIIFDEDNTGNLIDKINELFKDSDIKIFDNYNEDNNVYKFDICKKFNKSIICIHYIDKQNKRRNTTLYSDDVVHFYDNKIDIYHKNECCDCNTEELICTTIHKSPDVIINDRYILKEYTNEKIIKDAILNKFKDMSFISFEITQSVEGNTFGSLTDFVKIKDIIKDKYGLILKLSGSKEFLIEYDNVIMFRSNGFVVYPSNGPLNLSNINMRDFTISN